MDNEDKRGVGDFGYEAFERGDAWEPPEEIGSPDLPPIWGPETVGEKLVGIVGRVRETKFNQLVRLQTAKGVVSLPIGGALKDIPWEKMEGHRVSLEFKGWVELEEKDPETGKPFRVRTFRTLAQRPKPNQAPF